MQPGQWCDDGWIGASELVNKSKYNACLYKVHAAIGFHGCIHADSGLHLGVDHDERMREDQQSNFPLEPGEMNLGDAGYVGAEQFLYPLKKPTFESQEPWDSDSELC